MVTPWAKSWFNPKNKEEQSKKYLMRDWFFSKIQPKNRKA
jgi:hypothetical protein